MTAAREFQIVMTKPAGAVCNLECRYCYYPAKQELYPGGTPHRMTDDLLEAYFVQRVTAATRISLEVRGVPRRRGVRSAPDHLDCARLRYAPARPIQSNESTWTRYDAACSTGALK